MKKKNLLVLLMIPFLISTLTIVSVNMTYDLVDVDISYIEWDYEDIVAYQITNELIPLKAKGVNQRHNEVSSGNNLVWTVTNQDGSTDPYATIVKQGDNYFLKTLLEGDVTVTCSNQKGNVSRSFSCIVFKDGYISIRPAIANSRVGKVDETIYIGEYDFTPSGEKGNASFDIVVECRPASVISSLSQESIAMSDTLTLDIDWADAQESQGAVRVIGSVNVDVANWNKQSPKANITVTSTIDTYKPGVLDFQIVRDGYNVYNYQQLLDCTNRSTEGKIAVLQVSFDSEHNYADYLATTTHQAKYQNVKCMGDLNGDGKADFALDNGTVVAVKTKYNHLYIDQWNKANPNSKISLDVLTGLYVQKDFYGNGHSINFHDLTYPSRGGTIVDGNATPPELADDDLFRGPKPFYTVGTPSGEGINLITIYGQDNSGMYARGNLVINDVSMQNCDNDGKPLSFLDTVGTVLDVDTDLDDNLEPDRDVKVVVQNCRLSNGKNVVRSFSSNLLLDNCMLSNAHNFLFFTGSNKFVQPDGNKTHSIISKEGTISTTLYDYLSKNGPANAILDDYLAAKYGEGHVFKDSVQMQNCLYGTNGKLNPNSIQAALTTNLAGQFKGEAEIKDCIMNTSGIAAIAMESLFNGPYLFNNSIPHTISGLFDFAGSFGLSAFNCSNISGTSYPVKVTLSGSTKFYDYKELNKIDLSGLVHEDISDFLSLFGSMTGNNSYNVTIDEIFPIKNLLNRYANQNGYKGENGQYKDKVNIPVVFYGGGANYSELTIDEGADLFNDSYIGLREDTVQSAQVNLLDRYMYLPKVSPIGLVQQYAKIDLDKNTLIKTVTIVTGYEPFEFVFVKGTDYYDDYLSKQPTNLLEQLKNNAK